MTKREAGELMPHELPHEFLDGRDLLGGLPKLPEKITGPYDMTPAAHIPTSKSDNEIRSQRLHVYNNGEVCVDMVLYYKSWGDGGKTLMAFEPTGRVHKGAAPASREQFLLDKPVPIDLLRHIRGHVDGFDGAAGEVLLHESIRKTLEDYRSHQKAWEERTYEEVAEYWAAARREAEKRLASKVEIEVK